MKKHIAISVVLSVLFMAPGAFAADDDPVLARVNGSDIRLSEVTAARQLLPEALQQADTEEVRALLLETIIDTRLAATRARELGMDKKPEFTEAISRVEGQLLKRMLFSGEIEKSITEEKIKSHYNDTVASIGGEEQIHARHILLKTEEDAAAIITKLDNGGDFIELARTSSVGPSAPNGGDLGWFGKGQMVPVFEQAAFAIKPGSYSKQAVKSDFGWHVIRVEERRKMPIPTLDEAREEIVRELSTEVGRKLLDDLRKDAKIERF